MMPPQSSSSLVYLVASGDLRPSANVACWPGQLAMEQKLTQVVESLGARIERAHPFDEQAGHGFISSQKQGMAIFADLPPTAPIIVAESVWQYSHHVLAGLISHRGPILTVANWSGQAPGLVGMLNLNGSLTKAEVSYSTLWSETFEDEMFREKLSAWLSTGTCEHETAHVKTFAAATLPGEAERVATVIAEDLRRRKSIMGVFDEGCMGMFNAIIPDALLFPCGVFKERLSQSALYYATTQIPDAEARAVYEWYLAKGLTFHFGSDPETELTEAQVLEQCKVYIAVVRIADEFGCETVGIQYQQGLKDLLPASDLVEGTLNNRERPPVRRADGSIIRDGEAIVHFNEVDECAGLDALFINRIHRALEQPVETTLHDLRWGDHDASGTVDDYVWVWLISGAAPPEHHIGGWAGSDSHRQPPVYFRLGGGSLRGVAKPGEIVWSRIYVANGRLNLDIGRGKVVALPEAETERRWQETTYQWPIMHAVIHGVSRDQMMARHQANHVQVVYANSATEADLAAYTRAALAHELGIEVSFCGTKADGSTF